MSIHLGRELRVHTLYFLLAEEPPAEGDAMTAEVHEGAAAGLLDIPEPVGVRARVLLGLFHEMNAAESAFIRHLLRLHVLWREEELLRVEEKDTGSGARVDHRVGFLERDAQRLLANNVFSSCGSLDRDAGVKPIRRRYGDHLDRRVAQHLTVVGIETSYAVTSRKRLRIPLCRGCNGYNLHLLRHCLDRCRNAIRLEARADDSDSYFGHELFLCATLLPGSNCDAWRERCKKVHQ